MHGTVRPSHTDELSRLCTARKTTTKRTSISVGQQWRWHKLIDECMATLREMNKGVSANGRTFDEVAKHFVLGGDETCFMASDNGVQVTSLELTFHFLI